MNDTEFLERCTHLSERHGMPLAKGFVLSGVVPGVMYSDDDWGEWPSACLWREHLRKWLLSNSAER